MAIKHTYIMAHKPKLREEAALEMKGIFDRIMNAHSYPFKTCLNCDNFSEEKEGCSLANGQRPPSRVIAFGCDKHQDRDQIPF